MQRRQGAATINLDRLQCGGTGRGQQLTENCGESWRHPQVCQQLWHLNPPAAPVHLQLCAGASPDFTRQHHITLVAQQQDRMIRSTHTHVVEQYHRASQPPTHSFVSMDCIRFKCIDQRMPRSEIGPEGDQSVLDLN